MGKNEMPERIIAGRYRAGSNDIECSTYFWCVEDDRKCFPDNPTVIEDNYLRSDPVLERAGEMRKKAKACICAFYPENCTDCESQWGRQGEECDFKSLGDLLATIEAEEKAR